MQQNSFQKNGFVNINNANMTPLNNGNFGRRSIQDIRDDMLAAKTKKMSDNNQQESNFNNHNNSFNNQDTHKQRVENLRNFDRWK